MPAKIFATAESRLIEIWNHTLEKRGEKQADAYIRELVGAIHSLSGNRHRWRRVPNKTLVGVWFVRHEHHDIFFREISDGGVGVITVLHESMDLPARLKDVRSRSEWDDEEA